MLKPVVSGLMLIVIICLANGCSSFRVEKQDYTPQYMCTGDDLHADVRVNKKIDRVRVFDNTGTRLAEFKKKKRFVMTVPNIRPEQIQFKIKLKHGGRKKTKYSDFELFDDPAWSSGVENVAYGVGTSSATNDVDEISSKQICPCKDHNSQGECTDCYTVRDCQVYFEYELTLNSVRWTLPDYNYSPRIVVSGARNQSSFRIDVTHGADTDTLNPNTEKTFPAVGYRQVSVYSEFPTLTADCGEVVLEWDCSTREGCDSCEERKYWPSVPDPPEVEECFPDLSRAIQLRLECQVP